MAILTASIPIFWPLVTSLAANKILIVNEIEIRTERIDNSFALSEQGKGFAGVAEDDTSPDGGRTSRVSVVRKSEGGDRLHRTTSRLTRSTTHKHKPSTSDASDKEMGLGLDIGHRPSQDSQRKLNLSHQISANSFGSSGRGRLEDSAELTHARYQDKYTQDWAVPDFNPGGSKGGGSGGVSEGLFTTSVERAQVPYDHIRALEK